MQDEKVAFFFQIGRNEKNVRHKRLTFTKRKSFAITLKYVISFCKSINFWVVIISRMTTSGIFRFFKDCIEKYRNSVITDGVTFSTCRVFSVTPECFHPHLADSFPSIEMVDIHGKANIIFANRGYLELFMDNAKKYHLMTDCENSLTFVHDGKSEVQVSVNGQIFTFRCLLN